jgi:hypothetical protein
MQPQIVHHRGVPIKLSSDGQLFYADYRAISGFVTALGDVAKGPSQGDALREAQAEVDRTFASVVSFCE